VRTSSIYSRGFFCQTLTVQHFHPAPVRGQPKGILSITQSVSSFVRVSLHEAPSNRNVSSGLETAEFNSEHVHELGTQEAPLNTCSSSSVRAIHCWNGEEERESCCIEGATVRDYIHKRAEYASNRGSREYGIDSVLNVQRCQADIHYRKSLPF
jgi:hypothetical protein